MARMGDHGRPEGDEFDREDGAGLRRPFAAGGASRE
jgi:hypothetical protein